MSPYKIEDGLGIGHGTLNRLIDGRMALKLSHLVVFCKLLDIHPRDLIEAGFPDWEAKHRLNDWLPVALRKEASRRPRLGGWMVEQLDGWTVGRLHRWRRPDRFQARRRAPFARETLPDPPRAVARPAQAIENRARAVAARAGAAAVPRATIVPAWARLAGPWAVGEPAWAVGEPSWTVGEPSWAVGEPSWAVVRGAATAHAGS